MLDAEVSEALLVLREKLAAHTVATQVFPWLCRGHSTCAEEFVRLIFFKGMTLVVRAYFAVLPAYFPVLFGILYNRCFAGFQHDE